ncbi:hypothetical protein DPMN_136646 [Dreissena polymorpha]|uniref:Uncharacterized protein n=1 Tax=Dreissena polymorpha TaxID=45954 RepID=A0A9D4JGX4_DREPO|nr:hypothetical protein DPMN_136646 [Dreissena polymorpha]
MYASLWLLEVTCCRILCQSSLSSHKKHKYHGSAVMSGLWNSVTSFRPVTEEHSSFK